MNLQPSNRRQDVPVRLGSHGYRIDGDFALLNAELHVPPYFSGQDFGLELWACDAPHAGGDLAGVKVAAISLELPTPIGPHLHRVEARAAVTPPFGESEQSMVLLLVEGAGEDRRVHDYANYSRLQQFASPRFDGAVGYTVEADEVVLSAESVVNPRSEGNSSGSLILELWALSEPYASGAPRGHRLAGAELGNIFGQYHLPEITCRTTFAAPPVGRWHVALLLREWTVAQGYVTRDSRSFDLVYEQTAAASAPEPVIPAPVTVSAAAAIPAPLAVASVPAVEAASDLGTAPAAAASSSPTSNAAASSAANGASTRSADKLRLIKPGAESAEAISASAEPAPTAVAPAAKSDVAAPAAPVAKDAPAAAAPVVAESAAAPVERAVAQAIAKDAAPVTPAVATEAAPLAKALPTDVPGLDAKAAPSSAPPAAAPAELKGLVSINAGSIEELSKLPGLNLKVAKEIVKSRPFANLDGLIDVRGVGEKTLRRIRSLLAL